MLRLKLTHVSKGAQENDICYDYLCTILSDTVLIIWVSGMFVSM